MLIRRDVYESIGGHEAFKGDIVEDLALARNVKRAGFRLLLADGRALVTTRMYASLKEIWQGWSKNMCAAHTGENRFRRMTMYVLYGLVSTAPLVVLIWSAAAFVMAADPLIAAAGLQSAAQILLLVLLRTKVNELFRVDSWYALGHPLAGAVFLGMIVGCGRWRGDRLYGRSEGIDAGLNQQLSMWLTTIILPGIVGLLGLHPQPNRQQLHNFSRLAFALVTLTMSLPHSIRAFSFLTHFSSWTLDFFAGCLPGHVCYQLAEDGCIIRHKAVGLARGDIVSISRQYRPGMSRNKHH